MSKVFLAAGVAALAIAAPAAAGPGGHGGGHAQAEQNNRANARAGNARVEARSNARVEARAQARNDNRQAQRQQAQRQQAQRQQMHNRQVAHNQQVRDNRAQRHDNMVAHNQQVRQNRAQAHNQQVRDNRAQRHDNLVAHNQQVRQNRMEAHNQQVRDNRAQRHDNLVAHNQEIRQNRIEARNQQVAQNREFRRDAFQNQAERRQAIRQSNWNYQMASRRMEIASMYRAENRERLREARVEALNRRYGMTLAAPYAASSLLGIPLAQANGIIPLQPLPSDYSYLYPDNRDYYYRYGDGYLYQVNRSNNLIDSLIPLLAGGYMPGTVLPQNYMSSYVPTNYGWNSFYPSSSSSCTRYANGVVYYVDCGSGMIEDVVPVYNNGYGVGQMLPSNYSYYNVPDQYRNYYADTSDYGYWYAPGAIYQYDNQTNLITSVAALLGQGLSVGQPLPAGYSVYNVPMQYRDRYYDTPDAMYRYSNGYVYQVNPVTQLVTSIVASALT